MQQVQPDTFCVALSEGIVMRHEVCKNAENKELFLQMPKQTNPQTAALNIMDYLFINDVESLASFNHAKNTQC